MRIIKNRVFYVGSTKMSAVALNDVGSFEFFRDFFSTNDQMIFFLSMYIPKIDVELVNL